MPEQPSQSFKLKTEQTFQAAKEIECASIALLATNTLHHSLWRSRRCRIIILCLLKIYSHAYHGLWSARTSFSASKDIGVSHFWSVPTQLPFRKVYSDRYFIRCWFHWSDSIAWISSFFIFTISFNVSSIILAPSNNSCSVITNGGANRIMLTCVGFANSPRDLRTRHTSQAVLSDLLSSITIAFKRPRPRTKLVQD